MGRWSQRPSWRPRLSAIGSFKDIEHRLSLFASRGNVAANGAELLGSIDGAECAGDLLLDLDHADVSLALVVVKGHTEVVHKGQDFLSIVPEAVQEILGRGLLLSPSFLLGRRVRSRIGREAVFQDLGVAPFEVGQGFSGQIVSSEPSLVDRFLDFQEQIDHLGCPGLLIAFVDEDQFTEVMGVA